MMQLNNTECDTTEHIMQQMTIPLFCPTA